MSKVKKRSGLTGERNAKSGSVARAPSRAKVARGDVKRGATASVRTKAKAAKPARKAGGKIVARSIATRPKKTSKMVAKKASSATRRGSSSTGPKSVRKTTAKSRIIAVPQRGVRGGRLEPIARYAIKALDPLRKCGPGTSVQYLYRVDESVAGKTRAHLVFFDRHGWYCEHGRTCPAVAPARKYNGHIARVS